MTDSKPEISKTLDSTHAAFHVTGEDHVVATDTINGTFSVLLTGELEATYTDASGLVHQIAAPEELITSGAAEDAANIQWVKQPWFKIIRPDGLPIGEEVFDYLEPAQTLMQQLAEVEAGVTPTSYEHIESE